MAKSNFQQIRELIDKSSKILITTKTQFSGDGLASALALFLILKKLNKNADLIINNFRHSDKYSFLPAVDQIKDSVKKLKKFIINLDIAQTGIEDLNYDIKGSNLRIHISPKQGVFTPEDLKFETSEFAYDLIFVVDVDSLESLGSLYDHHRDFFYQTPVVNLGHSSDNEQFGHLNLVDITASSTSEIIYKMLSSWPEDFVDEPIASCLLAGLISKTKSFKTPNLSPEALNIAGELIRLGADRQKIVQKLYQTKTIPTLRLWGKILSRLQDDLNHQLVWSKLDTHDFTENGASPENLSGVMEELIANSPLAQVILVFYQISENQTKVLINTPNIYNAFGLVRQFSPTGDKNNAQFILELPLAEAETQVMQAIKSQIKIH